MEDLMKRKSTLTKALEELREEAFLSRISNFRSVSSDWVEVNTRAGNAGKFFVYQEKLFLIAGRGLNEESENVLWFLKENSEGIEQCNTKTLAETLEGMMGAKLAP